jgi:hypothetical protein
MNIKIPPKKKFLIIVGDKTPLVDPTLFYLRRKGKGLSK